MRRDVFIVQRLRHFDRNIKTQFDGLRAEMEKWKNASDRQLATIRKKDLELDSMRTRIQELEDEVCVCNCLTNNFRIFSFRINVYI